MSINLKQINRIAMDIIATSELNPIDNICGNIMVNILLILFVRKMHGIVRSDSKNISDKKLFFNDVKLFSL